MILFLLWLFLNCYNYVKKLVLKMVKFTETNIINETSSNLKYYDCKLKWIQHLHEYNIFFFKKEFIKIYIYVYKYVPDNKTRSNLPFQIALYLNLWLFPIWLIISIINLDAKVNIIF